VIEREFKAQIIDDFKDGWLKAVAINENFSVDMAKTFYDDSDLDSFAERISGQIVTITHNTYVIGSDDFFEKIDNNFVMYEELFIELTD